MKPVQWVVTALLLPVVAHAQQDTSKWNVHLRHWQGINYNGHVQVRENANTGTHFDLVNDLGMRTWIAPSIGITHRPNEKNSYTINFCYQHFTGSKMLGQDAWYNGTHLEGNTTASIDKSIFYRAEAIWEHRIMNSEKFGLNIRPSIVYDFLVFDVDAPVLEGSPRNETYEHFFKQELPLPNIGFSASRIISTNTQLTACVSGTYLPKVKTWMEEGGDMWLKQSNIDLEMGIMQKVGKIIINAGYHYRYFSLLEESGEDTNDFMIKGHGLEAGITLPL